MVKQVVSTLSESNSQTVTTADAHAWSCGCNLPLASPIARKDGAPAVTSRANIPLAWQITRLPTDARERAES